MLLKEALVLAGADCQNHHAGRTDRIADAQDINALEEGQ